MVITTESKLFAKKAKQSPACSSDKSATNHLPACDTLFIMTANDLVSGLARVAQDTAYQEFDVYLAMLLQNVLREGNGLS